MSTNQKKFEFNFRVRCKHCGRDYLQYQSDQCFTAKIQSEDICPYCKNVNNISTSVEFENCKIDE